MRAAVQSGSSISFIAQLTDTHVVKDATADTVMVIV
jgi:hypothetical protein